MSNVLNFKSAITTSTLNAIVSEAFNSYYEENLSVPKGVEAKPAFSKDKVQIQLRLNFGVGGTVSFIEAYFEPPLRSSASSKFTKIATFSNKDAAIKTFEEYARSKGKKITNETLVIQRGDIFFECL